MLVAAKGKMSSNGKNVNRNTYNILSIKCVTRKCVEFSGCSHEKEWERNV